MVTSHKFKPSHWDTEKILKKTSRARSMLKSGPGSSAKVALFRGWGKKSFAGPGSTKRDAPSVHSRKKKKTRGKRM